MARKSLLQRLLEGRAAREVELVSELARSLGRAPLRSVLEPALSRLSDLGLRRAVVVVRFPDAESLAVEFAAGETGHVAPDEGLAARAMEAGEPFLVPRLADVPGLEEVQARRGPRKPGRDVSAVSVPIVSEGRPIGAVVADRARSDEATLQADARLLEVIAALLAGPLEAWRRSLAATVADARERHAPEAATFEVEGMVGNSKRMLAVYGLVEQVAKSHTTVLLLGESGTGKELVARALHRDGLRPDGPFVQVNCAALPDTLIESELFGHERGAFTGATRSRAGRFEQARGGTLFLDEIGELGAPMQAKLLRVLQEGQFRRVGGDKVLTTDARVVAATNRDLTQAVLDGTFREDLLYRLNVFPIQLPALRQRRTDIPLLADHFARLHGDAHGKPIARIATSAIDLLVAYHWPGNVRELGNCIERAVLLTDDGVIHGQHLPPTLQTGESTGTRPSGSLEHTLAAVERELVVDALRRHGGNMAASARELGVSERVMGLRVKKYRLDPSRFK
jgi:Nif-specific regulatory protein